MHVLEQNETEWKQKQISFIWSMYTMSQIKVGKITKIARYIGASNIVRSRFQPYWNVSSDVFDCNLLMQMNPKVSNWYEI